MPYNKVLKPAGKLIFFGDSALENHALDLTFSPDSNLIAVEGRFCILILNANTDSVVYRFSVRDSLKNINTYSGISCKNINGRSTLFWSVRNAIIKALWDGSKLIPVKEYKFGNKKTTHAAIPNEIAFSDINNPSVFYAVINGNNKLIKTDIRTGQTLWQVSTGLAPYGIVFASGKLYVSNWSGSKPNPGEKSVAGIPWDNANVDSLTGAVNCGSVSVFSPDDGKLLVEIPVGLHPNDIISSPDRKFIYVANGNDDYISVISTDSDKVTEKIPIRLMQENNPFFGDSPNGLAISKNGQKLYVSAGMDNAIAVITLGKNASSTSKEYQSIVSGYIPTAAYPAGIILSDKKNRLYVANLEGTGARLTVNNEQKGYSTSVNGKDVSTAGYYNSHRMLGVVSSIPVPDSTLLKKYTATVNETNRMNMLQLKDLLPRKDIEPVPVPERTGEPSVFKHVIYIIKENRTYDQILGDMTEGDGEPYLCAFGENITPNIHKLAREYVLLDRYMASGKCSSEGHLWTDASIVTDYVEKNVRAWFRSYTHVLYDAMAYPKTGFIWDNAIDHGKTVRIYGEAAKPVDFGNKSWSDIYNSFIAGKKIHFKNYTTIDRVKRILSPIYPSYDSHRFPDIMRASAFITELKEYEKMKGDKLPELIIMALPDDHTAGTAPGFPTMRAMVADNDLALGQIIQAVSESKFWKNTVIFVTEDDSQAGWDHISAYRTVGIVISPYSKTGKTISTSYNQTSMIRTIEQILGLPPMNIEDATADLMTDVFTKTPDTSEYKYEKNRIPLNEMNPEQTALKGQELFYAKQSARLAEKGIDAGEDELLNHIVWYSFRKEEDYPEAFAGNDDDDD
ncbi:MAG: bifunctional YncE family protein/alkaline phosphatase family protein [Chlorobi bacterium]|nr:bifunctional YncE family protein/alkaline phosphatase family protein [Chlorobiota bacterium]